MDLPAELQLSFDGQPAPEVRSALGLQINAFHAQTVPQEIQRFAILLHDGSGQLAAGLSASLSWHWMFVEALWVSQAWRGRGVGRGLLMRAEAHARSRLCHSVWLDTFQARGFYAAQGYDQFGSLPNYPGEQTRYFLSKRLAIDSIEDERIDSTSG
jgi:N-acetylglutamate synthase-like GNAT family acetyltransferase